MKTEKHESQLDEQSNAPVALADLPVTTEQTERIKGGSLSGTHKVTDVTLKRGVIG